ncbi:MAG: hypothetical protein HY841_00895 [Bacteroidetes bacterium]|nr:hypothetical protein [Bacteroidota bacterium]
MKKFTSDFSVPAETMAEAEAKMEALKILATFLTSHELKKLAHVVKNDPVKTSLAKSYLGL